MHSLTTTQHGGTCFGTADPKKQAKVKKWMTDIRLNIILNRLDEDWKRQDSYRQGKRKYFTYFPSDISKYA